jgi:hypothetical protein
LDLHRRRAHLTCASAFCVGIAAALLTCCVAATQKPEELPMPQPASNQPADYTFSFRSEGGGEHSPGVYAYLTDIRVSGKSRRAVMLLNRHNGDLLGRAVGLFSGSLQHALADSLSSDIEATRWAELPQPTKGDVNSPMLHIDYSHAQVIIRRSFNARNLEFIRSIPGVMKDIDDVGSALLSQPARAVSVAVARTGSGFNLTITNVGTGTVMIADPRPNAKGEGARAAFKVAESAPQQPGTFSAPPIFKPLALQPREGDPKPIELAPGKSFTADSVPWPEPAAGGKFVAQASWTDYDGPEVEAKSVMPTMPDPESTADARPYVVRGAAFSKYLNFTVEKK